MAKPKTESQWLLLIHQLPPKPDYLRVKVRRRLHKIGAIAVKNTVYVLPNREQAAEDFHWIATEIRRDAGEAIVCEAEFVDGLSGAEVIQLFNKDRDAVFAEIALQSRELLKRLRGRTISNDNRAHCEAGLTRLKRNAEAAMALDFFGAPGRSEVVETLSRVEHLLNAANPSTKEQPARTTNMKAWTWVTRENVFVDRMASAWLIKRFIDTRARFKFVDPSEYRHAARELRFDMFDGEYTHRGDRCTFEVLLDDFGLKETALHELAQVIHDIDMKDDKFERAEASGVSLALRGLRAKYVADGERIAAGSDYFDGVYEALRSGSGR